MENRKPLPLFAVALLAAAPLAASRAGAQTRASAPPQPVPFVETNPANADPAARFPKYLRVNVDSYHVRSDTDFDVNKRSNINHKTVKGALYAVTRVQKMERGLAVGVYDDGHERWIYVPNWRKHEFQFCESEACFADLAEVLKSLEKQDISSAKLAECGIQLDENGALLNSLSPLRVDPEALPKPRPTPIVAELDGALRPAAVLSASGGSTIAPPAPPAPRPAPRPSARPAAPAPAPRPAVAIRPNAPRPPAARPSAPPRPVASSERPRGRYEVQRRPVWETNNRDLGRRWTAQLSDALDRHGQGLLNRRTLADANEWCPNYSRLSDLQRKEFWMHVFPAMARFESGYDPTARYDEASGTNPRRGRVNPNKYSMGLMQLSYATAAMRPYRPFCNFDWSRDRTKDVSDPSLTIYDTQKNLDCAVGIMNKWVTQDGRIGGGAPYKGGSRFWSTNRYSNPKTRKVRALARLYGPCSAR